MSDLAQTNEAVAVVNRPQREDHGVVERARRFVNNWTPTPPIPHPQSPDMPMTRERFEKLHGGKGLTIGRNGLRVYYPDGATETSSGFGPVYNDPPPVRQDRLLNQITYLKRVLFLHEQKLRDVQTIQLQSGRRDVVSYQMGNLAWDRALFGEQPLDRNDRFDIDAAIKYLTSRINQLRTRFRVLRFILREMNPHMEVEERFITT